MSRRSLPSSVAFAVHVVVKLVVVVMVVGTGTVGGCQIFGLVPAPCSNENTVQECRDRQVCVDGACAEAPVVAAACPAASPDAATDVRSSEWEVTEKRGALAGGSTLFGLEELLAFDLSCASSGCPGLDGAVTRVRAPLPEDVGAASFPSGSISADGALQDTDGPFAFELIYRAPSSGEGTIAAVSSGAGTGWRVVSRGGDTVLLVGETEVILTIFSDSVWTHLLCFVDPERLTRKDPAGVLCSVDGNLPVFFPPTLDFWSPAPGAPLVLGDEPGHDGAIALVRLWNGRPPELPSDPASAQSELLNEGRKRLLSFLGIDVRTAGELLFTNIGFFPRVIELYAPTDDGRSLALVGGSWPRLAKTTAGTGLLFEWVGETLASIVAEECAAFAPGPLGKNDACELKSGPIRLTPVPTVELSTFSIFYPAEGPGSTATPPTSLTITLKDSTENDEIICSLPNDSSPCVADSRQDVVSIETFGSWRRLVVTAGFEVASVTLEGAGARIWSAQLEPGSKATSPIPFLIASTSPSYTNRRELDAIGFNEVGLGLTNEMTLDAQILEADDIITPVIVLDDEDSSDGIVELQADFSSAPPTASFLGRVAQQTVDPSIVVIDEPPTRIVGHIGRAVSSCTDCNAIGPVRAAPIQSEVLYFLGPSAVVRSAGVSARGSAPKPTELRLSVEPPVLVPCVAGSEPLFVFGGCADRDGPCLPPDVPNHWDGALASTGGVTTSAFPGEVAVTGSFTTDLLASRGLGDLYVEVRFRTPSDASGGSVLTVLDVEQRLVADIGLRRDADDATYSVVVAAGDAEQTLQSVGPGEWNQVACLFGVSTRCILNLSDPVTFANLPAVRGRGLVSALVASVGDGALASARGSFVDAPRNEGEAVSFLSTRALESFGFHVPDRRAPLVARERRGTASFVRVGAPGRPWSLERIGAHWPRVETVVRALEYVVEPGATALVRYVLSDAPSDGPFVPAASSGPHPALPVVRVSRAAEIPLASESEPGVVSVFVNVQGGASSVELESSNDRVALPENTILGDGGIEDFGEWKRLWVRAGAGQPATLRAGEDVLLSAAQRDARAVLPGPPALDDAFDADLLVVDSADIGSASVGLIEMSLEPTSAFGQLVGLQSSFVDPSDGRTKADLWSLGSDGGSLLVSRRTRAASQLFPIVSSSETRINDVGAAGQVAFWWHGSGVVVRKADGGLHFGPTNTPTPAGLPERLFIGNAIEDEQVARLRMRSITIRRGDF